MPLRKPFRYFRLRWNRRFTRYEIADSPHFESPEAIQWFKSALAKSAYYLEYGSGASTFLAAQLEVPFTTVESNPHFLNAVKRRISDAGFFDEKKQTYRYAKIGLTKQWGVPALYPWTSFWRLRQFARYSDPDCPEGVFPDLILVDGRFRVACALKVIRMLLEKDGWTLVVDDYTNRPQYHVIENFAQLDRCIDNLAIFTRKQGVALPDLEAHIKKYQHDYE